MHESDLPVQYRPRPKRPWWRGRLFLGALLIVLLLVGGFVGVFLYQSHAAKRELRHAIAKLDEKEPEGWRMHEIEARRAVVPDEQNSAFIVLAVHKRLPLNWPSRRPPVPPSPPPPLHERLAQLPLDQPLDEALARELREELERVFPALAEAQQLADRPAGRYPINWNGSFPGVILNSQHARSVGTLLQLEATLWAQDGHPDCAGRSVQGILNCARSIGDEPSLMSMLFRVNLQGVALRCLERALAQGEPSVAALTALQRLLEDEVRQPLLWTALRGERAFQHETLNELAEGKISLNDLTGGGTPGLSERLSDTLVATGAPRANACLLRLMTERVEIAWRPVEEHANRVKSLPPFRKETSASGILMSLLLPAVENVSETFLRGQAKLRCGLTAVAAERYRQRHGCWPDSLDDLVKAQLLAGALLDPFDGAPVRLARTATGVTVYSTGLDSKDDDGNLSDDPRIPGTDLGFRLWDVDRRRGPAHEWIPAPREAPFPDDPP